MENNFNEEVYQFIKSCNKHGVKMILVGGSAVNYYGYKRHSADIDFWIDNSQVNFGNLVFALQDIGYHLDKLPEQVLCGEQNISLKFSPELEIEIITSFNPGKTFDEALNESIEYVAEDQPFLKWNIISLTDLITSKIKSGRPKDLMDVFELQKIIKREK